MFIFFIGFYFLNEYLCKKNTITYVREEPVVQKIEIKEIKKPIILKNDPLRHAKEYKEPNSDLGSKVSVAARKHEISAKSMTAVMWCESSYKKTAKNHNKNGSVDGGISQINSVHDKELKELGLDKNKIEDSLDFMALLIKRNGMRDYKSSQACWSYVLENF